MSRTTITLDKRHFKAAVDQARDLGKTPEGYIGSLIDAASLTFDEILAPVRAGIEKSGVTEQELDDAVTAARKAIRARSARKVRK
jgi:hypothetical protein